MNPKRLPRSARTALAAWQHSLSHRRLPRHPTLYVVFEGPMVGIFTENTFANHRHGRHEHHYGDKAACLSYLSSAPSV